MNLSMSLASDVVRSPESQDVDRNLALLAYGLLFFAIFFAGVPALVAVAIAYSRRREAAPRRRTPRATRRSGTARRYLAEQRQCSSISSLRRRGP